MGIRSKRSRRGSNVGYRSVVVGLALAVAGATAACDGDSPTEPLTDMELVRGEYEVETITFDPQGAAAPADVLAVLTENTVEDPRLNIGRTGNFQFSYRDPVTADNIQVSGTVVPTVNGVDLRFNTAAEADQFLFPDILPMDFDEETRTLSFSGTAQVDPVRLQELFPEQYGDEPWENLTAVPGTLTVIFQQPDDGTT